MAYEKIIDQAGIASYVGKAERCVFEFRTPPEWVPGENWLANNIINKGIAELQNQGSKLLWIKVWRDIKPLWHTDYRVEVTATASPLWWTAIIIGILVIAALVVSWQIISVIEDIDWGEAGVPVTAMSGAVIALVIGGIILIYGGKKKLGGEYGQRD